MHTNIIMQKIPKKNIRVVVYIKDIEIITGRKRGAATKLYWEVMRAFDKKRGQFITFQELSIHTGIDETVIEDYLKT
jgi:hypothetical protein